MSEPTEQLSKTGQRYLMLNLGLHLWKFLGDFLRYLESDIRHLNHSASLATHTLSTNQKLLFCRLSICEYTSKDFFRNWILCLSWNHTIVMIQLGFWMCEPIFQWFTGNSFRCGYERGELCRPWPSHRCAWPLWVVGILPAPPHRRAVTLRLLCATLLPDPLTITRSPQQ